ncbi:MAG: hypothetical protein HRU41_21355 [Saprospiraceae bacterium]|nr:hypothetical protein [Saprospiraceae bacterium]
MKIFSSYWSLLVISAAVGLYLWPKQTEPTTITTANFEIYVASKMMFYSTGPKLVTRYLILLPDGTALKTLPKDLDLNHLHAADLSHVPAKFKGSWEKQGKVLQLHWPTLAAINSIQADRTLKAEKQGWRQSKTLFYQPLEPLTAKQLLGTYKHASGGTLNMPGQASTIISKETAIRFSSPNQFDYIGTVGTSSQSELQYNAGGATGTSSSQARGTFTLDGFYLELKSQNGNKERYPAFLWPGEDNVLTIGRAKYLKQ